jgi:hypothetical protein
MRDHIREEIASKAAPSQPAEPRETKRKSAYGVYVDGQPLEDFEEKLDIAKRTLQFYANSGYRLAIEALEEIEK